MPRWIPSIKMNYTTILWDLDGTIVDSGPGIFDTFRKTFDAMGIEQPTEERLRTFVGPPLRYTFSQHMGLDEELTDKALETYKHFYHRGGGLNASMYPGVLEVVARSKAAGRTNALATSKALAGVQLIGEHYDFLHLFDFLGTADPAVDRFAKTDVIAYALDGLRAQNADLSRIILIGDRIHDIEGARDHGIEVALVQWGYGSTEEWAEADHSVANTDELAALLGLA